MSTSAMAVLGPFVFSLSTAAYQSFQHEVAQRHPSNSRVGARPARQHIGPDDEQITLPGTLLPELTGGPSALSVLRYMSETGKAWPFLDGTGNFYGMFVIEKIRQERTYFFQDGAARKVYFTLNLSRVDDDDVDQIASVLQAGSAIAGMSGVVGALL